MSAVDYQQLIGPLFPSWGFEMGGIGWQLQQDNSPIHIARSTLTYFKDRNHPLFQNWPSKSSDMNIMENVWNHVARYVYAEGRIQFPYQIITKKQSALIHPRAKVLGRLLI